LKIYDLKEKKPEEEHDKPSRCPRCSEINPPYFKFCGKCGIALDLKAVMDMEERMKTAYSFLDESLDEKDLDKKLDEWVNRKVEPSLKHRLKSMESK